MRIIILNYFVIVMTHRQNSTRTVAFMNILETSTFQHLVPIISQVMQLDMLIWVRYRQFDVLYEQSSVKLVLVNYICEIIIRDIHHQNSKVNSISNHAYLYHSWLVENQHFVMISRTF